jgi:hypothetical protein
MKSALFFATDNDRAVHTAATKTFTVTHALRTKVRTIGGTAPLDRRRAPLILPN